MADGLTHLDDTGQARMVDVSDKQVTERVARVGGEIRMQPETAAAIGSDQIAKGNVLTTARIAGIQAAKRTAELIPLCHPVNPTSIEVASVALLTIYDMCKAIDRGMVIGELKLLEKDGGRSGRWVAADA